MKLVRFYHNEIPTDDGDFIGDILSWNNELLEGCHSYIQWLFPLVEGSMFHPEAPRLTPEEIKLFKEDEELQNTFENALFRIFEFYSIGIVGHQPVLLQWADPSPWWTKTFNHNHLRISRILKSCRYLGYEEYALALFALLQELEVSENTMSHWQEAATGELP